jgi:WD40 repeat protein
MGCGASANGAYARHHYLTSNKTDDMDGETYTDVIPVWSIALTTNGFQMAAANSENVIVLWDLKQRTQLVQLLGHADTIWKVAYSPDDEYLASASSDGTVRIWEVRSGMPILILPRRHTGWVGCLAWSPDPYCRDKEKAKRDIGTVDTSQGGAAGLRLATGGTDTKIIIWDIGNAINWSNDLRVLRENPELDNPDYHEELLYMEEETGKSLVPLLYWQAHEKSIKELQFAANETSQLVSIGAEGTLAVWDSENGLLDCRLTGHIGTVNCMTVNPVLEEIIATGGEDHTVRLWDLRDIEPGSQASRISKDKALGFNLAHFTLIGHEAGVSVLRFSRDARLLASASKDCEVRLWNPDLKGPTLHAKFTAHEAWVRDLQWTFHQDYLYTASSDGHIFAFQIPKRFHCKFDKVSRPKRKGRSKATASSETRTVTTSEAS